MQISQLLCEGRGLSRRNDSKGGDSLIQMGLGLWPRPIRIKESPLFRRFSLTEYMKHCGLSLGKDFHVQTL